MRGRGEREGVIAFRRMFHLILGVRTRLRLPEDGKIQCTVYRSTVPSEGGSKVNLLSYFLDYRTNLLAIDIIPLLSNSC